MLKSESACIYITSDTPLIPYRIKESLRKHFADLANDFERRLSEISSELAAIEGPLEVCTHVVVFTLVLNPKYSVRTQEQQEQVQRLETRLPALSEKLAELGGAEEDCQAANVDENDYTVFTFQDLEFEHELVIQGISKKIAFIDNQVRAGLCR